MGHRSKNEYYDYLHSDIVHIALWLAAMSCFLFRSYNLTRKCFMNSINPVGQKKDNFSLRFLLFIHIRVFFKMYNPGYIWHLIIILHRKVKYMFLYMTDSYKDTPAK